MTETIPTILFTVREISGWLHSKCINLLKKLCIALGEFSDPYICPHCKFNVYQEEINNPKVTAQTLTAELACLKPNINEESTNLSTLPVAPHQVNHQPSINLAAKPEIKLSAGRPETSRPDRIKSDIRSCLDVCKAKL